MQNVSLVWLGGDFGAALASIYLLKEYYPSADFMYAEIGLAVGSGFLINVLFFAGQTPVVMFLHALVAGLMAWILFPKISNILL